LCSAVPRDIAHDMASRREHSERRSDARGFI